MNKEIVKKAFESAEQELENKQIEKVKNVVKDTLRKIKDIDNDIDDYKLLIKELEEDRKILRLDIDDLKEGHLDRIEERQKIDSKAKEISVIIVEKEVHHHHYDYWYQPYVIKYVPYVPPTYPSFPNTFYGTVDGNSLTLGNVSNFSSTTSANNNCFTLTASVAKNNTVGAYDLGDKVINLR